MRFGLISEADTTKGLTHYHRYHEVVREAQLAEGVGFDFWGTSEQHFFRSTAPISAPETLYAYVAAKTSRIKIRHMSVLMIDFNHPIRVAERLATLDILSHGRVEFGTARSNNTQTLDGFGVEAGDTREQWRENIEITLRALTEDPFQFEGKHYKIPPRTISPIMYRDKLFPVSVNAATPSTFTMAGEMGLGVLGNDSWLGWEFLKDAAQRYLTAIRNPRPIANYEPNRALGFGVFNTSCARSRQEAIDQVRHVAEGWIKGSIATYTEIASRSKDYAAAGRIKEMEKYQDDLPYLMSTTPNLMIGTPDDIAAQVERLQALGFDEIAFRIDGMGHRQNLKTIELIGKYVIPAFKVPSSVIKNIEYEEQDVEVPKFLI